MQQFAGSPPYHPSPAPKMTKIPSCCIPSINVEVRVEQHLTFVFSRAFLQPTESYMQDASDADE